MSAPRRAAPIDLKRYIRDVADFPKKGILFRDITPLLAHGAAFRRAVDLLAQVGRRHKAEKIAAIESRGFLFGSAVAQRMRVGVVPIRKKGKLPYRTLSVPYQLEYGQDTLEMHVDGVRPGERVLVVDDVLATGGTAAAVVRLIREARGAPVASAFLIELGALKGRARLGALHVTSLVKF